MPQNPQCPTDEIPVVQSYVDVIVQAFLPHGEVLTRELILSFEDLDRPWLNDREMPRYARYLEQVETQMIDGLFREHAGELFEGRTSAEERLKVKTGVDGVYIQDDQFL